MRYTVVWRPSAESQLASIWNTSAARSDVSKAADSVDRILRDDPLLRGETYSRTTRSLIVPPLLVMYRVYEDDRLVRILAVDKLPESGAGDA